MTATAQVFATTYEGPDEAAIHHEPTKRTFFVRWERAIDQRGQIVDRMTRVYERLGDIDDVTTWRLADDVDLEHEALSDLADPDYRSPDDLIDAAEELVLRLVAGRADTGVAIKVRVEQTAAHTYLAVYTKSHGGDTFGLSGRLCMAQAEAEFLLSAISDKPGIIVVSVEIDTSVSGYSIDVEREMPGELDFCFVCWREREDCYCRDNVLAQMIDPGFRPADCTVNNGLLGYDPLETVVGFEKLVAK